MPTTINGIVVFDKDEPDFADHPAVKALEGIEFGNARLEYGFQLIIEGGKKFVIPLSKDEWTEQMKTYFGDNAPEMLFSCAADEPPYCNNGCFDSSAIFCRQMYNPRQKYYFCGCTRN